MKPKRIAIAHELIEGYNVEKHLNIYVNTKYQPTFNNLLRDLIYPPEKKCPYSMTRII